LLYVTYRTVLFGIPGWEVTRTPTGWTATRQGHLSERQIRCGCLQVVTGNDFGTLELAIAAEKIKADIIAVTERLAERMAEADQQLTGRHGHIESKSM
jgi:hypothetical protein